MFAVVVFGLPERLTFIAPHKQKAPSPQEFGRIRMVTSSNVDRIPEERGLGVRSKRFSILNSASFEDHNPGRFDGMCRGFLNLYFPSAPALLPTNSE
ncbi:MAG: hypothetical protein ACI814_001844 [Mariniblastus sp.]|jgi:hypothetical protein